MGDFEPIFSCQEDALSYYRTVASEYRRKFGDVQRDLEEFQESSRDLEAELEMQLSQSENKNKEMSLSNQQLKLQNDRLQAKLNECQAENSTLRDEVHKLKAQGDDLQKYVRKLEQKNDDFERATRASLMSLEDFESRLNQAIERNAFLENELDEKENMTVLIQRLKDEARDLKQELCINDNLRGFPPTPPKTPDRDSSFNSYPATRTSAFLKNSSSIVPHSALNILGDLLKKVGVLESKLQSCRESVKENSEIPNEKGVSIALTSSRVNGSSLKDFIPLTATLI